MSMVVARKEMAKPAEKAFEGAKPYAETAIKSSLFEGSPVKGTGGWKGGRRHKVLRAAIKRASVV